MLNGLDLFSGIGGITIALSEWVKPVAYCENDKYPQTVLLSLMEKGEIPTAPIWDDVATLKGSMLPTIDIIYGGFPCQDISIAGAGKGLEGKRSGLVGEIYRLTSEIKPRFVFLENVPAITFRGGTEVVREFTKMGYDCRWCIVSAAQFGAAHKRERWFLLAHATSKRWERYRLPWGFKARLPKLASNSSFKRLVIAKPEAKPELCRATDGLPNRAHRIKSLGNAVVPLQAKKAFEILIGVKN